MVKVVGVRFRKGTKIYFFEPGSYELKVGDAVIVETVRGTEMGWIASGPREVEEAHVFTPLREIIRLATDADEAQVAANIENERTALVICQERIDAAKLEMKLVDVEYAFDGSKVVFYFTANGRVDFRALVKNLASIFKTRIELRQIGVRDEAKLLGGLGSCGRPICCGAFLANFQPVSIKMAKDQNLSLNPTKISGLCGRLMCCLKYEQDNYEQTRRSVPRPGKEVMTPDGLAVMVDVSVVKDSVIVKLRSDEKDEPREYPITAIQRVDAKPGENLPLREDIIMIEESEPIVAADALIDDEL